MSDADARSDIEREFEDAVKTADAYLRAVGVLDPIAISDTEYREREIRVMRDNILKGWGLDAFSAQRSDCASRDRPSTPVSALWS